MTKKLWLLILSVYVGTECFALDVKPPIVSYLNWRPTLSAEDVFKNVVAFTYIQASDKGDLFWVEQRPDEEGRCVLVQRDARGISKDLTPPSYSVRTRVYEYGGRPYVVKGSWVYFVNFKDQRIYRQNLQHPAEILPLTPKLNTDGSLGKYMDLTVSPDGNWLVFVYEKEVKQGENPDFLAILNLKHHGIQAARILAQGANFYKLPQFSPDGTQLGWLEWNHPYMPWDSTQLYLASIANGKLNQHTKVHIAGDEQSSISSFAFLPNGELYFAQDFAGKQENDPQNFYNIYHYKNNKITAVTQELGDFQYITSAGKDLLTILEHHGQPKLLLLQPTSGMRTALAAQYSDFGCLGFITCGSLAGGAAGQVYAVGFSPVQPSQLVEMIPTHYTTQVLKTSAAFKVDSKALSKPMLVEFRTTDGQKSYGYFYPPANPRYMPLSGEKPPVRVLVHGGPTSRTTDAFSFSKLFWTSQGFAIFDVNYRGSIGFGRQYRDALKTKWGLLEIQDVKDGLTELKRREWISDQAVVSGGSAGGYTVERLLTYYPDLFAAGASYYGVGNLITLQKLVHKFESHYLSQLVGGTLETNLKEYHDRSPIYHLDQLKAPMILFQGSDDKVVAPENSREIARLLSAKGIEHEYYEYSGEAHGFRKKENLVDSLEKEAQFFKKILWSKE